MSLFDQPEQYNGYDNPDRTPRGNLTVGLVGSAGEPYEPAPAAVPATATTSFTGDITASNQQIDLEAPSGNVTVKTDTVTGTSAIFVTFDGTPATTDSFRIDAGGTFTYTGPAITAVNVIGESIDGTFSVFAS